MKDRGLGCAAITEEQLIDTGTFCPDSEPQGINFNTVCQSPAEKMRDWKATTAQAFGG